jgi:hypothetical protein
MRRAHVLVATALIVALRVPTAAQELKPPADLFRQKKPAAKPPAIDWNARVPSVDESRTGSPLIVCGMTLVPADPKVDPKFRVTAPEGPVSYAMRKVPPPICKAP